MHTSLPRLLRRAATAVTLALAAACNVTIEPPDPHAASWYAEPAQLFLTAGVPDTLAITFLTDRGVRVEPGNLGWLEWRVQGNAMLSMQTLWSVENPQRFVIQAAVPTSGTLIFRVGETRGCPDPPLCLIQHWEQELTDLVIPFRMK